jgi:hypothetical protein
MLKKKNLSVILAVVLLCASVMGVLFIGAQAADTKYYMTVGDADGAWAGKVPSDMTFVANYANINEAVAAEKTPAKESVKQVSESRLSYEAEKQLVKQRRKIERRVEENEKAVNELEAAISCMEALMSTPEGGADSSNYEKYASLKRQLNEAMDEWEKSMEELENFS